GSYHVFPTRPMPEVCLYGGLLPSSTDQPCVGCMPSAPSMSTLISRFFRSAAVRSAEGDTPGRDSPPDPHDQAPAKRANIVRNRQGSTPGNPLRHNQICRNGLYYGTV